jgi:hypothetical protein
MLIQIIARPVTQSDDAGAAIGAPLPGGPIAI